MRVAPVLTRSRMDTAIAAPTLITSAVALFTICNPIGTLPVFLQVTAGRTPAQQRRIGLGPWRVGQQPLPAQHLPELFAQMRCHGADQAYEDVERLAQRPAVGVVRRPESLDGIRKLIEARHPLVEVEPLDVLADASGGAVGGPAQHHGGIREVRRLCGIRRRRGDWRACRR